MLATRMQHFFPDSDLQDLLLTPAGKHECYEKMQQ